MSDLMFIALLGYLMLAKTLADTRILYTLSLNKPLGNSRNEVISLHNEGTANEELVFEGTRNITHNTAKTRAHGYVHKSFVQYRADENGYYARFSIVMHKLPMVDVDVEDRLSAEALKSAAG